MTVLPSAKLAATASTGYSSIIEGARAAGTSTPRSAEDAHAQVGHLLPAVARRSSASMSAPISRKVVISPVRSGFVMTSVRTTSEPGTISAATIGNAAEEGSAGTRSPGRTKLGLAPERDAAACRPRRPTDDVGTEMGEQALGVVAACFALDHGGLSRRGEPREQYRGFDLRRGNRRTIDNRHWVARAGKRDRQPASFHGA